MILSFNQPFNPQQTNIKMSLRDDGCQRIVFKTVIHPFYFT